MGINFLRSSIWSFLLSNLLLLGCTQNSNSKISNNIVTDSSDINQKRILLLKWHEITFDWNTKCVLSYCYEKNTATDSFMFWEQIRKGLPPIIWRDTVDFWGNYFNDIDTLFINEDDEYIEHNIIPRYKKMDCMCQFLLKTEGKDTFAYPSSYSSYRFKKESIALYPYEISGSGLTFSVDESYFYDTLKLAREQQFVEFLKTQSDSIKQEYEWAIRYRGYGYLFDDK